MNKRPMAMRVLADKRGAFAFFGFTAPRGTYSGSLGLRFRTDAWRSCWDIGLCIWRGVHCDMVREQ